MTEYWRKSFKLSLFANDACEAQENQLKKKKKLLESVFL